MDKHGHTDAYNYISTFSRRDSLKCLGLLMAGGALTGTSIAVQAFESTGRENGHWPKIDVSPINAKGYGQDPNLIIPPESPWPLTLTQAQLSLVAHLSDIVVPQEGNVPSASKTGAPDIINEWMSAPYERQQHDRKQFLHLFSWLDTESKMRYGQTFILASEPQRLAIIRDIANTPRDEKSPFMRASKVFMRFKELVLAAFFSSPAGWKDIGYMGNVPINGDYPGPTDEAMLHLDEVLKDLGLREFAYKEM